MSCTTPIRGDVAQGQLRTVFRDRPVRLAISRSGTFSRKYIRLILANMPTVTIAEFVEVLNAYVRWYNEKRIKGSLGYLSPIEYRESLGLAT